MKKTVLKPTIKRYPPVNKKIIFLFTALLLLSVKMPAQLIGWNTSALNATFGPSPWTPAILNSNLTMVTGLSRGANLLASGTPATGCWGASGGWSTADAGSFYFTFRVNAGFQAALSSISGSIRRSNSGPTSCNIEYSVNGGAYALAGSWTNPVTTGTVGQLNTLSLTTLAALQTLAAGDLVRFRVVFPGASGGNFYLTGGAGALNLNGTVTSSGPVYNASITRTGTIQCNGQSNGGLTATINGGTAPYTYSWIPSGGTASVAAGLAAGNYTCIITDALSASTSASFSLMQPAVLTSSLVAQINVSCGGNSNGSATIAANGGVSAYTYSWLPSGGSNSVGLNLQAGNYTVNILDANNCGATRTVSIIQPISSLTLSATHTLICQGATVSLHALGADTYTWSNTVLNGTPFSPSATLTYSVAGTNTTSGCVDSGTIAVFVNPGPTLSITSGTATTSVCNGSSLTLNASGASTYSWSGGISNGVAFSPSVTTSYTATGTDTNNCSGLAVISVTVNSAPTLEISQTKTLLCRGETGTLTASGAHTYSWSTNATTSVVAVSPTLTTNYVLWGKDLNGCVNTATLSQKVSGCAGILSFNTEPSNVLTVFPNPNAGDFTIQTTVDVELLLINQLGQTVQKLSLDSFNNRQLQLQGLSRGIYFLLSADSSAPAKQKIIVTK